MNHVPKTPEQCGVSGERDPKYMRLASTLHEIDSVITHLVQFGESLGIPAEPREVAVDGPMTTTLVEVLDALPDLINGRCKELHAEINKINSHLM